MCGGISVSVGGSGSSLVDIRPWWHRVSVCSRILRMVGGS